VRSLWFALTLARTALRWSGSNVYTLAVSDSPPAKDATRPLSRTPQSPANRDLGMRATLLFPTREIVERYYVPLIYTACRTCYSELEPQDIFERATSGRVAADKQQDLVRRVIDSGHGSTIEHIVFTFAITGVSRTLSHQLVRHRAGVAFDQQSQRYVKFKGAATMLPHSIAEGDPELRERYESQVDGALGLYGEMLATGVPGEDARFVFPNATRTNLVMTTNLRALIHMSGLRLCTMAQWEIRRLFQLIRHEIFSVSPFLGSFLAPKCVPLGYCDEFNNRDGHCPIRPHKDRVLEAWAEKAAAARASGRELPQA
jgi:thymidylate synthase (FAD)